MIYSHWVQTRLYDKNNKEDKSDAIVTGYILIICHYEGVIHP